LIVKKLNHPSKPLCWASSQAEEAFQALEKVITVMLVLAMPNFSDMGGGDQCFRRGIGTVLSQHGRPVPT